MDVNGSTVLQMNGITKRFPGVVALDDVSFDCRPGEVHALVGENGAGKSTLMKILSGVYLPDEGTITLGGRPMTFRHPREAQEQGISIIYQEFNLLPYRTVAQNMFLGREPMRRGLVDERRLRADTLTLLRRLQVNDLIDPDMPIRNLPVARQQLVEIAKALSFESKVLVMDEPTAALSPREVELLMRLVQRLRDEGMAIVYISHRFREVFDVADRITVLKDGKKVDTVDADAVTPGDLIQMMIGRPLDAFFPEYAKPEDVGDVLLEVKNGSNQWLHDINLSVRAGEIVGVAGLDGSGRGRLLRALFGVEPFTSGTVYMRGRPVTIRTPLDAVRRKLGFLTEDRKDEGLALMQSVKDNVLLAYRTLRGLLARIGSTAAVENLTRQVDLRAAGLEQEVRYLSGGNQQKVVLAKWLAVDADVLMFSEPTRGIDVNAKAAIHQLIRGFARSGKGVIMASSELPELIGMSDRIVVMWDGRIAGELPAGASEADIMFFATGQGEHRGPEGYREPEGNGGSEGIRGSEGDGRSEGNRGAEGDGGSEGNRGSEGNSGSEGNGGSEGNRGPDVDCGPELHDGLGNHGDDGGPGGNVGHAQPVRSGPTDVGHGVPASSERADTGHDEPEHSGPADADHSQAQHAGPDDADHGQSLHAGADDADHGQSRPAGPAAYDHGFESKGRDAS